MASHEAVHTFRVVRELVTLLLYYFRRHILRGASEALNTFFQGVVVGGQTEVTDADVEL
jgi:hypothetical protein